MHVHNLSSCVLFTLKRELLLNQTKFLLMYILYKQLKKIWHEPCLHNKEVNIDLSFFSTITEKKMLMQEAGLDTIDFSVEGTADPTGEVTKGGDSVEDLGEDSGGVVLGVTGVTGRPPTTILLRKTAMKIMIRDTDFIINRVQLSTRFFGSM